MKTQNIRLIGVVLAVGVLLLIPYFAMKFTGEVNWTPIDFITAGVLLLGTGLACEFVLRKVKSVGYRLAICAGILFVLFIIWAELAVGLIGTPFAGS
jgi:threonine/homoserine efflux transporter RhtA